MAKDTSFKDGPTTVSMLKGSSLTSVVQQELERSILTGEFAPGTKLVEAALANKLGVSRGPVREAFRMLEEAGLVVNEKNRGVFVRDLPVEDALEIYELRAHMEQAVGRRLAVTITREQLKEVRWMVESMERSAKLQDRSVYHLLNLQFHEHLVDMAGNRRLSALHRKLTAELALFRRINLDAGGALPLSNTGHRGIVKAIAAGDADAAGVNLAHLDVELSEMGMKDRKASVDLLRQEFAKVPGAAPNVGGFISHRMDEVLSGVRSAIAVKIFGSELEQLRTLGQQVNDAMQSVEGIVDLQLEPQIPVEQIQIQFDRGAAARYGLTIGQLAETIETALNGRVVSQVLEQQQTFDLVVWLKPEARQSLETIGNLLVDTPSGNKIPLAQVARVQDGTGPNTINRENVSRLIVVAANAQGRDLRSVVNDIQAKVKQQVQIPAGYYIQYAGQFEAEERASQNILIFSAIAFVVITVIMYLSVKSIASTTMIMINLPLALVGGVIAVALTGGVLSIASLVGFVTLFGVATRNGLLLVDNYNTKFAAGMPLKDLLIQGSMERLNAILMTAFTSALGLAPLVIAGGPGKELLQPLAIVVLGGLFTSTALTLLVLPALYAKFGKYLLSKQSVIENGKVLQLEKEQIQRNA